MFLDHNGSTISGKDMDVLIQMVQELKNGFVKSFVDGKRYCIDDAYVDSIIESIDRYGQEMVQNIRKAQDSEEVFNFEDFYNRELVNFYNTVNEPLDTNAYDYGKFEVDFGRQFVQVFSPNPPAQDTTDGVEASMESFKLPTKAFAGIEQIEDFDPETTDISSLSSIRKANSNTYEGLSDVQSEEAKKADASYNDSIKYTITEAARLKNADHVSFSDVYGIFSGINQKLRYDDENGGKLRVDTPEAGIIKGISAITIPKAAYRVFSTIADQMNVIKQTKDPLLKKSQAIQLASFAYQMSVSEHLFEDANGRSCRMLADTILQSFGLPPHSPNIALIDTGATIGNKLDFDKGAKLFVEGVKVSNEILNLHKNNEGPELDRKAEGYLDSQRISRDVLKELGAKEAISIAVQQRENKFSFCDALDDFIKANHFGSMNSPEYKNVIKDAKEAKKLMQTEPTNSAKAKAMFAKLNKTIDDYEKHCKKNPRPDKTRAARLKSVHALGTALFYTESLDERISKIQSKDLLARNEKLHDQIISDMQAGKIKSQEGLAKLVICNVITENYKKNKPELTIDQCEQLMKMDSKTVDRIAKDPMLMTTLTNIVKKGALEGKDPAQQLDHMAKQYKEDKIRDFSKKELAAEKAGKKEEIQKDPDKIFGII